MNNYDKIKNMDLDTMIKKLISYMEFLEDCDRCPINIYCDELNIYEDSTCQEIYKQWLEDSYDPDGIL